MMKAIHDVCSLNGACPMGLPKGRLNLTKKRHDFALAMFLFFRRLKVVVDCLF